VNTLSTSSTYYRNIDALRAIAVMLVMIVHFPRFRNFFPNLNPWSGVDLFFAISGFVVAKSFLPQLEDALLQSESPQQRVLVFAKHTKAFFVRRFMRVTPAVISALVFYLAFGYFLGETTLHESTNLSKEVF